MRYITILTLIVTTTFVSQASAAILEGPTFANGLNQYTLLTGDAGETAADLQSYASGTLGGNLVTINDATENAFLVTNFSSFLGTPEYAAIGYNDIVTDGDYVWFSGETSSYENWAVGEPNNGIGFDEEYTFMAFNAGAESGLWLDAVPNFSSVGIAEVLIPEPASLVLLGFGSLLITMRKRRTV